MSFTPGIWNAMIAMAEEVFYAKGEPALSPLYLVLKTDRGRLALYKYGKGFVQGFDDKEELHRWIAEKVSEPMESKARKEEG